MPRVRVSHVVRANLASGSTDLRCSADTCLQSVYAAAGLPPRGGRPVVYHFADTLRRGWRISFCVPPPERALSIQSSWLRMVACIGNVCPHVSELLRVQPTRLETRTKESIHVCEYAMSNMVCAMNVTVGTRAPTADDDFRRDV